LADASPAALARRVRAADTRAIAEALALIEDTRAERLEAQRAVLGELAASTPAEHGVVGLTGPPGVGKSTLAGALMRRWLDGGLGVGMVAIDPSSRRSGGALLGDRARLRLRAEDRAFVRSMAARERLGGLAPATRGAALVLRAAFQWTLVETVGVGQSEIDVATVADCVVLVLQPGSGDALQFMKAGILEIPDVVVVHKWDLGPPARRTREELESMLRVLRDEASMPAVIAVSSERGVGVEELQRTLETRTEELARSGELARRRAQARTHWALELLVERYGTRGLEALGGRESVTRRIAAAPGTALDAFAALDPHG
jgi:LAO/AO transport system kinase